MTTPDEGYTESTQVETEVNADGQATEQTVTEHVELSGDDSSSE